MKRHVCSTTLVFLAGCGFAGGAGERHASYDATVAAAAATYVADSKVAVAPAHCGPLANQSMMSLIQAPISSPTPSPSTSPQLVNTPVPTAPPSSVPTLVPSPMPTTTPQPTPSPTPTGQPDPKKVAACYAKMKDTAIFRCLETIISNRPPARPPIAEWPEKRAMEACGCMFTELDDETGVIGRPLFYCDGDPTILISPFYPGLGVMNPREEDCMFDLMPTGPTSPPKPESPPKDRANNCFNAGCHDRASPER